MNVRTHMSMLFHMDKCIGCHTCSIACKNLWTDRKGAEYMWWNNVETRPGSGYPTQWENQEHFKGGWTFTTEGKKLSLRLHTKAGGLAKLYFNPDLPTLEDYYEPFTFRYADLFDAPAGTDQPTAIPISMVTGEPINIEAGPNWDDDLGGSPLYATNDPNRLSLSAEVRAALNEVDRVVFNYMPRICNHCLNPACVAACPSGAIYKRAEDGVVLVNENQCRAWRMCVAACPYKKVYYNWGTGKSEKCILCFPRMETGQAPACAHSCVGRIRYMGVMLYDADRIPSAAAVPDDQLVDSFMDTILDPFDPKVIEAAKASGVEDSWIRAAQKSPVYKFVKVWKIALPLHLEYRTMAMMFYVPPMSPIISSMQDGNVRLSLEHPEQDFEVFENLDKARIPIKYLANLFSVGNEDVIRRLMRKAYAVRTYMRRKTVDHDINEATLQILSKAGLTAEEAEDIYDLTTQPHLYERFVLPPYRREMSVEAMRGDRNPLAHKGEIGFGAMQPPQRGD